MSYIPCSICGGGVPGTPCVCSRQIPIVPTYGWQCPVCRKVHAPPSPPHGETMEIETMTDRKALLKAGYTVKAEETGAEYPNYAPDLGLGWEFVLTSPDGKRRTFSTHQMAWLFADRLSRQFA